MSFFTHCDLTFTVERASIPIATLEQQLRLVPIPTDLLTGLGVYVETDATTSVAVGARTAAQRAIRLRLGATAPATISLVQDSNNRVVTATVVGAGAGFGGQPIYDLSQFFAHTAEGASLPPNRNGVGVPQIRVLMKVDGIVLAQGGSGYTAPTVTIDGNTTEGGSKATAHATVIAGVVTAITVDTPGSGYCMAPRVNIHDSTGEGAQAMATLAIDSVEIIAPGNSKLDATLFPASPTLEAFDMVGGATTASVASVLGALMQRSIQNATRFPVSMAAPIVT